MMNNKFYLTACLLLLALSGCQIDDFKSEDGQIPEGVIAYTVNGLGSRNDKGMSTKVSTDNAAEEIGEMVLRSESGKTLTLAILDKDGIDSPAPVSIASTKSEPVTSSNLSTIYGYGEKNSLGIRAYWTENTTSPYIADYLEYHSDATEQYKFWLAKNGFYYWPKVGSLDFWAWAPNIIDTDKYNATRTFLETGIVNADHTSISFEYTLGKDGENDAVKQPDLMFSRVKDKTANNVDYVFKHALSAIKFQIASNLDGNLMSISLKDVLKTASCVYAPESMTSIFTWEPGETPVLDTFTQKFGTGTSGMEVSKDLDNPTDVSTGSAVFMMIPQEISGSDRQVQIVIGDETYSGYIPEIIWEAGHTYIYTVKIDGIVEVEVDDTVTAESSTSIKKSDVTTKNTGSATVYLRAAIAAAWYYGYGSEAMAVSPFTGTLPTPGSDSNWFLGSDGFYYYKNPVMGGNSTNEPIFETFAIDPSSAPMKGTHLEMQILLQGVRFDANKTEVAAAWGSTIAGKLETKPEIPTSRTTLE